MIVRLAELETCHEGEGVMSRKRKQDRRKGQHVAPACYLAEFTRERSKGGRLWGTDKERASQWPTTPAQAARHNDYYTGDFGNGLNAYGVEISLSKLEDKWAPLLKTINQSEMLPRCDTEEFADLIEFVAFQAMRTPTTREQIGALVDAQSKAEAIHRLDDGRDWDGFVKYMHSIGESVPLTREELLAYARQGQFTVSVDKTWTIQLQLWSAINLFLHLSMREWSLFIADDSACDYVCSDSPVCVTPASGNRNREPGYCNPRSVVTIPLGSRLALAGFYEGSMDMVLPEKEVAGLNTMTIQHCRQIFSREAEFKYLRSDGTIGGAAEFVRT